MKAAN